MCSATATQPHTPPAEFRCSRCGLCCQNLPESGMAAEYRKEGGSVCRHFDARTNLCTIYATRPPICRVDEGYSLFFSETMSKEEYYRVNYEICGKLMRASLTRDGGDSGRVAVGTTAALRRIP